MKEKIQKRIQQSDLRPVNSREDCTDNNYGENIRDIENNPEKILSFDFLPCQNGRKDKRQGKCHNRYKHNQKHRILE